MRASVVVTVAMMCMACRDTPTTVAIRPDVPISANVSSSRPSAPLPAAEDSPWYDDASPVGIASTDPSWGSRRALVTIVHAAALGSKDPFLAPRFRTWLATRFGEANTRLVWVPFYVNDVAAFAVLGCAAHQIGGSRALWSLVDILGSHAESGVPEPELSRWARSAGVPLDRTQEAMQSPRCQKVFVDRAGYGGQLFQRHGATTFVNGIRSFVISYPDATAMEESLAPLLEAEIRESKALLANGTPPDRIYLERSTANAERAAYTSQEPTRPSLDTTTVWKSSVGNGPANGPATALVTAVLYCAPMEPTCRWVYDRVQALVPRRSLRFVLRPLEDKLNPCDAEAVTLATVAARKRGAKAFYGALDALFALQPKIKVATDGSSDVRAWNDAVRSDNAPVCTPVALRGVAKALGISYDAYAKLFEEKRVVSELRANRREAETLDGTGALFVSGRRLGFLTRGEPSPGLSEAGVTSFIERVVEEEEAKARARVSAGADPTTLYEAIVKDGFVRR